MYYAGIDVGGTTVKLGILNEDWKTVWRREIPTLRGDAEALSRAIAAALFESKLPLRAAGISCAGRVNLVTRRVTASNLRWDSVPFAEHMETALGCPVAIDNDIAGALMGEWKLGACAGEKYVLYMALGTGIGGAFLIDGKPFRGWDNTGGEVGHMVTHADGLPCVCGGRGCFEQYASAKALEQRAGGTPAKEVFARAEKGDKAMCDVLDDYVHELVIGIAGLLSVFRPQLVVIGGGLSLAGEALLSRIRAQLAARCPCLPKQDKPCIVAASLGNDAGFIGGAMLAMEIR